MPINKVQTYQVAQIREFETIAQERFKISAAELMQRAGKSACGYLKNRWPDAKSISVFCGTGNNGGDGYILAAEAKERGLEVNVYQIGDPAKLTPIATAAYVACKKAGVPIQALYEHAPWHNSDVLVDAIYGIGLDGEIPYDIRQFFSKINQLHLPVLSLDIPSGVFADSGDVLSIAINATATITFIGIKPGLVSGAGAKHAGDVYCDTLQLPTEIFADSETAQGELDFSQFTAFLKPRPREMHKGDAGHVLIIGSDPEHSGAARLAAQAALRVGAGLVTVATHPAHAAIFNATLPEVMCVGVRFPGALKNLITRANVIVIGPGLGQSGWSKNLWHAALNSKLPLVVDADALNLLASQPRKRANWILTPHPGEAGRLLKKSTEKIQADRGAAVKDLQKRYDGICVLKGAHTLVESPQLFSAVCKAGNPGMATAGMGDVLSGVIGGLVAQQLSLIDAARLGVLLHATAADKAAADGGERGMIATDLMPFLRQLANHRI